MSYDPQERLRTTIRLLGNLLGEIIREQEGEEIFRLEEHIRTLSKAWRAGDRAALGEIQALLPALLDDLPRGLAVLKAFTTYFQLVNLAEEQERSETLLRSIFPRPIAERLKVSPEIIAERSEDVSVLFAGLVHA